MVRRGRSSTSRGVQRDASLLVLAVLAGTFSMVSCFIVSSPVPVSRSRPHAKDTTTSTTSSSTTITISPTTARHGTRSMLEGARGAVRRQRSSCFSAAEAQGGEGDIPATAAADAAAAAGDPSLSSSSWMQQSTAPSRTEIPTDVAVVGAPQQVGSVRGRRRPCAETTYLVALCDSSVYL